MFHPIIEDVLLVAVVRKRRPFVSYRQLFKGLQNAMLVFLGDTLKGFHHRFKTGWYLSLLFSSGDLSRLDGLFYHFLSRNQVLVVVFSSNKLQCNRAALHELRIKEIVDLRIRCRHGLEVFHRLIYRGIHE